MFWNKKKKIEQLQDKILDLEAKEIQSYEKEDIREIEKINMIMDKLKEGTSTAKELKMKTEIWATGGVESYKKREEERINVESLKSKLDAAETALKVADKVSDKALASSDKLLDIYEKGKKIGEKFKDG